VQSRIEIFFILKPSLFNRAIVLKQTRLKLVCKRTLRVVRSRCFRLKLCKLRNGFNPVWASYSIN